MTSFRVLKKTQLLIMGAGLLAGASIANAQTTVFQAEDYDNAYDTTPGNSGGAYRNEDVDIEVTTDTGGGYNVGWIDAGEWLAYYNLNIPTSGKYTVRFRVASEVGGTLSNDLNGGSIVLGSLTVPNTGGWQNWQTISHTVHIDAGTYSLGVYAVTGNWNLNWIEVVPENSQGGVATVHEHCDYNGWSASLDVGSYNLSALQALGFVNDAASSIKVSPGYQVTLYEHDNFTGASVTVTGDNSCLTDEGFNDNVSSIVVSPTQSNGLVWSDEFDTIDMNNWSFETGGGGWGNNELQYYTNGQNAFIEYDPQAGSNVLVIEARREGGNSCWYGACEYTSSRMITAGKKDFQYGRIEARIKLPQTQGIWPAFWMLGSDIYSTGWPNSGEIDIMEHVGYEPTLSHGALHGPGYYGNTPFAGTYYHSASVDTDYHVYAVEWDSDSIHWFVDGNNFYSVSRAQVEQYGNWVFDHPFYILLNVAVGGNWPGSPDGTSVFPQRMYVDYVRVYQ
ncbi:family 16 glycosylhydrolase [Microbulbifer thermotolerans]|uniref:Beta glucanase n=1 Tax=Microbulbifer thermotolerans TaxID=252514 RepID=A0A143HL65_MICTH|nr:family 16 glycosylhydrolase [Microbulbifer thermotolerans]AMX02459.1 beta glucanase [Microbulbifer thermotolerans]MCX2779309.1 family 16 glycosylhydrolase [Microbulbifer thermotolerans]MCX2784480.1 family 16 glycosylhydrolase [Microbulbifer thermotolerans]MCX2795072.1 family 16 glycosylhydrolase [Microbulbifer thermotolerans]MCX2803180.1 family 16 glycosylhydrolase [Microbulbifer thermotolerans]